LQRIQLLFLLLDLLALGIELGRLRPDQLPGLLQQALNLA
jgi:hypothetical protein